MSFPEKKYSIIYADPAWEYRDKREHPRIGGGASKHYDVMSIEDIKNLPVAGIANDDCYLFMWATFPQYPAALEVIKAWGFEYKTIGFIWLKTNRRGGTPFFGIGYYPKSNTEPCLLATRGKVSKERDDISSVVMADEDLVVSPVSRHSKKPDIVRNNIVRFCGDVPRIELFARQRYEGWDAWGNELTDDVQTFLHEHTYIPPSPKQQLI